MLVKKVNSMRKMITTIVKRLSFFVEFTFDVTEVTRTYL